MTLVVGGAWPDRLYMVADSQITNLNAVRAGPLYGALKNVLLSPTLVVAYAGNAGRAKEVIR